MKSMNIARAIWLSNGTRDESRPTSPDNPFVISYLGLRKAVGIIGCCLPFVLILGAFRQSHGFQPSLSSYYYTNMGDVFVGGLCAIGIFLMSCRGYDHRDALAGHLACLF